MTSTTSSNATALQIQSGQIIGQYPSMLKPRKYKSYFIHQLREHERKAITLEYPEGDPHVPWYGALTGNCSLLSMADNEELLRQSMAQAGWRIVDPDLKQLG